MKSTKSHSILAASVAILSLFTPPSSAVAHSFVVAGRSIETAIPLPQSYFGFATDGNTADGSEVWRTIKTTITVSSNLSFKMKIAFPDGVFETTGVFDENTSWNSNPGIAKYASAPFLEGEVGYGLFLDLVTGQVHMKYGRSLAGGQYSGGGYYWINGGGEPIDARFPSSFDGNSDDCIKADSAARLSVYFSKTKAFTARTGFGSVGGSFQGTLDENDVFKGTTLGAGGKEIEVYLFLNKDGVLEAKLGEFSFHVNPRATKDSRKGSYTFRAPRGDTYGSCRLTSSGAVTMQGHFADGTPYSTGTYVTADGEIPLYARLYRNTYASPGAVGFLTLLRDEQKSCSGEVRWIRPEGAVRKPAMNFKEINELVSLKGCALTALMDTTRDTAIIFENNEINEWRAVDLSGAAFDISGRGAGASFPTDIGQFAMRTNTRTGQVSGSVVVKKTKQTAGKSTTFSGVMVQGEGVSGVYRDESGSGLFFMK